MSNTANWPLAVSGTKACQTISGLVKTRGHLIMLRHAIGWNLRVCLLWLTGVESSITRESGNILTVLRVKVQDLRVSTSILSAGGGTAAGAATRKAGLRLSYGATTPECSTCKRRIMHIFCLCLFLKTKINEHKPDMNWNSKWKR